MISIGLPVFNGADYIRDAIDSILAQTFTNFELIISDNASTDGTREICEIYAQCDPRISYIRQNRNIGAASNFRFLLDQAKGEFFMWAAHDDIWAPTYLHDGITLLTNKSIDFVFPTFELRSIKLGIAKKFDMRIFRFIESHNRKERILNYISLHYLSHSANIVYSLFRTQFLRSACEIGEVSNDGVLGAIIVSLGRGAIGNSLFSKRYRIVWPGMLPAIVNILWASLNKRNSLIEAKEAIKTAKFRLLSIFPEYKTEIEFIFEHYRPFTYDRDYRVCSVATLL